MNPTSPPECEPSIPPRRSCWSEITPVQMAVGALVAVTLFRFWFSTRMGLVPDEAYYWLWSKHLALSYRDKGPAIAWTIALGTHLFGDTVFGIRFFGVLLSAGTAWQLFALARRLYDERTGLWCLVVALTIPLFAVGAILMTIDSLSVFFWAWGANLFWAALDKGKTWSWIALGLVIGCGFLAKFTNGVQLICIGLFLLWSSKHRPLLFSRQTFATVAAFCVSILPIIYWNYQVGWIHIAALHARSGVEGSFHIHPGQLLRFIEEQGAVVSPLLMLGMVAAAFGLLWNSRQEARVRFLFCQFIPLYAIFIFFSLNKAGQPNWPAPSLVTGIVMLVVFWRELTARKPAWRWAVGAALAVGGLMTAVLHNTDFLRLPPKLEPLRRAQGWPDFADHLERIRQQEKINLLIGGHYSVASMMQFYLPDRPLTYLPPGGFGKTQFSLWPGYELSSGSRALYVTESMGPVPGVLLQQFSDCKLADDFWSQHRGRPMTRFRVFLLTRE